MAALWLGLSALRARCAEDEEPEQGEEFTPEEPPPEDVGDLPEGGDGVPRLPAEQLRALHAKMDLDGSGKVSLKELLAFSQDMSKAQATKEAKELMGSYTEKVSLKEHLSDTEPEAEDTDEQRQDKEARRRLETEKFKVADLNGDGIVDPTEMPALFFPHAHDGVLHVIVQDELRRKDANGDGKLSKKEWQEVGAEGDGDETLEFAKVDANGDGLLDQDELKALESGRFYTDEAMKAYFKLADKDVDGQMTAEELLAEEAQLAEEEKVLADDAHSHFGDWAQHLEL